MNQVNSRLPQLHSHILAGKGHVWRNPRKSPAQAAFSRAEISVLDVDAARREWADYEGLLTLLFPELAPSGGRIDSPLLRVGSATDEALGAHSDAVMVKADHMLPVTGTVKARGGVFEVLRHAREVALQACLIRPGDDARHLASHEARTLFGQHSVMTGSTGNLGFSIGLTARALGFAVEVHMSSDAKDWKKQRLRDLGANVVEHDGDFGSAVSQAREIAQSKSNVHFVDDENSASLFVGYSSAAFDLRDQLAAEGVEVGPARPLVVYLPCGVGGAPGGITFGLKHLFGDNVHCVFVEPVAAPAMLVQLAAGTEAPVSVYDFGLSNKTIADGLAVAGASMLVVRNVGEMVEGIITVEDAELFSWLRAAWDNERIRLEPSAAAGFAAAHRLLTGADVPDEFKRLRDGVHVIWTTGGSRVPDDEFNSNLARADGPHPM